LTNEKYFYIVNHLQVRLIIDMLRIRSSKKVQMLSAVIILFFLPFLSLASDNDARHAYSLPIGFSSTGIKVQVSPEKVLRRKGISMQKYDYSCGSAALTTLANQQLGLTLGEAEVIEGLLTYGEIEKIRAGRRFSLLDMKRYLASINIKSVGYSAELEDLPDIPVPAIMSIEIKGFRHFVVFQGIRKGHVILADPAFGNMSVTLKKFQDLWRQKIFFTLAEPPGNVSAGSFLTEEKLRFVTEESFYFNVLRHTSSTQNRLSYRLQMQAISSSGILKPQFR